MQKPVSDIFNEAEKWLANGCGKGETLGLTRDGHLSCLVYRLQP